MSVHGDGKPALLDLFCCAGGAARGYQRAGFYVVGVDIEPQPNYAGDEFIQGDALDALRALCGGPMLGGGLLPGSPVFAAIHASPPCQAYSPLNAYNRKTYPDLVDPVRDLLIEVGVPYVIENVPQAPLWDPVTLCGAMFDLPVYRHRAFETSFPRCAPDHPRHLELCARNGYLPTPERQFMSIHGGKHSKAWRVKAAEVMEVPWMTTVREVCEAIPPAYTEHIGGQLMEHLAAEPLERAA